MLTYDGRRTTENVRRTAEACLYYKLTSESKGSGELISNNKELIQSHPISSPQNQKGNN